MWRGEGRGEEEDENQELQRDTAISLQSRQCHDISCLSTDHTKYTTTSGSQCGREEKADPFAPLYSGNKTTTHPQLSAPSNCLQENKESLNLNQSLSHTNHFTLPHTYTSSCSLHGFHTYQKNPEYQASPPRLTEL